MGIDRSNIRFILHVAMPNPSKPTSRKPAAPAANGLEAECVLLYSASDTHALEIPH